MTHLCAVWLGFILVASIAVICRVFKFLIVEIFFCLEVMISVNCGVKMTLMLEELWNCLHVLWDWAAGERQRGAQDRVVVPRS